MNRFFTVQSLDAVLDLRGTFPQVGEQIVPVAASCFRVLASDVVSPRDLPGFQRATMDGYAVKAADTYGASDATPAWLEIRGSVAMGETPDFELEPGQAARIATGGMMPRGADAVVMVEHSQPVDDTSVEIYKSVAPLQNVMDVDEDFKAHEVVLPARTFIRPQEAGLAAGLGFSELTVFRTPRVGIVSTGDEIVPITRDPRPGEIRDINSYALAGFVRQAYGEPVCYGIVRDDPDQLRSCCEKALAETDMLLISGGSSVGTRDYTVSVLSELPDTRILVHGISISPGKPTILAVSSGKPVWGLPGQVVSAMVVMKMAVLPFLDHIQGHGRLRPVYRIPATLTRNVASAQGRREFVRIKLESGPGGWLARPVLGKSGLIRTMIHADGLLEIHENREGYEKDSIVDVILL